MSRAIQIPTIDDIPTDIDPRVREVLQQIVEYINIREGRVGANTRARFVSEQELIDQGALPS